MTTCISHPIDIPIPTGIIPTTYDSSTDSSQTAVLQPTSTYRYPRSHPSSTIQVSMNDKGSQRSANNLNEARKRLAALQGPPITFKRPRQTTTTDFAAAPASSSTGTSSEHNHDTSMSTSSKKKHSISSPYGRCPNVSERYKKVARVGEGTYGIVYKAIDQENQQLVALKRCLPHHEARDGFPITTLREIQILREIALDTNTRRHDNIVWLKEVAVSSKSSGVFLVFEFIHFDLAKLIDQHYGKYSKSPFTLPQTKCLASQLVSALDYLHDKCIIHRDLKLSNLLYDKDRGLLKLADFGLARKVDKGGGGGQSRTGSGSTPNRPSFLPSTPPDQHLTPKVVSLWYRPPELLLNAESYTMAIDQWAAGCVIAELILGQPLFRGKNELDQLAKIVQILGPPTLNEWPGLKELPLVKSGSVELPFALNGHGHGHGYGHPSQSSRGRLLDKFSDLSAAGIVLFTKLLMYNPDGRWTAKEACDCAWFKEHPYPTNSAFMPKFENKL